MPAKPVDNASSGRVGAHALYMDCLGVYEPGYLARIGVDSRVDANSAIRYYEDGDWYLEPDDARLLVDVGDGRWVKAGQCDCVVSTIGGDGERQTKIIARDTVDSILAALSVGGMWHVKDDDVIRPWGEKAEEAHAYYSGERAFYGSAYVALPGADWRGDLSGAGVDVDALGALQVGSAVLWALLAWTASAWIVLWRCHLMRFCGRSPTGSPAFGIGSMVIIVGVEGSMT